MRMKLDVNKELKIAMIIHGWAYKNGAEFLGINQQTFIRKINHSTANGFNHRFNENEKNKLMERFNCEVE